MIKFGTSGFRGIIGDNWNKQNIQKIGFAFKKVIEAQKKKVNIVVGFDNRFMGRESSEWFCEATCCDLIHATLLSTPVPTPVIAYKATTYDLGVMFTASHNPYYYNGIKVFLHGGVEAGDDFFSSISTAIENLKDPIATKFSELTQRGIVTASEHVDDYIDKLCSIVSTSTTPNNIKALFNPMYGSSTSIVKKFFEKVGIEYNAINDSIDPYFGKGMPAPYSHCLTQMKEIVVKEKYDIGFALDGDGDRIAVIDSNGDFYDCNYLAAAIYFHFLQNKKKRGDAVKNFLTSNLISKLCKKYDTSIHETPVGFKFLGKKMQETDALLAAESGGIAIRQISFVKDGIATVAMLLDLVSTAKKSIGKIIEEITTLVNFPSAYQEFAYEFEPTEKSQHLERLLSDKNPFKDSPNMTSINFYADGFKVNFKGDYWCASRISGTENAVRIYTEMPNQESCNDVIKTLESFYNLKERQS